LLADGRTVPDGEVVRTSVCIVGAGPAGITLARRLAAAGVEVVLLERGGRTGSGEIENLGTSVNLGLPYRIDRARGTGFGGALHKWLVTTPLGDGFGRLREFSEGDFERREWVPNSGWPFKKSELKDYYRMARTWFDVPWPSEDPESVWDSEEPGQLVRDMAGSLLRHEVFAFANPANFASQYLRELDRSEKALVLTDSAAVNLRSHNAGDEISAVDIVTNESRFTVEAALFVLAAGAIENARLMLASRDWHPAGVGNTNDNVGRYFMEHPRFSSGIIEPAGALRTEAAAWDIHVREGIPLQLKYRFEPSICEREELANSIYFLRRARWEPEYSARLRSVRAFRAVRAAQSLRRDLARRQLPGRPIKRFTEVAVGLDVLASAGRHRSPQAAPLDGRRGGSDWLTIEVMAEQIPHRESRVTLHADRDVFGVPKAALDWRLTRQDVQRAARAQDLLGNHLESQGLGSVYSLLRSDELPYPLHTADHQMGTTRMHADPRLGVVDEQCCVHGLRNLFVAGPSVFPTGGEANPTLTTVALSLRLGDHLLGRLRH
jgi:choline dehydrogenase-like flavoprotein